MIALLYRTEHDPNGNPRRCAMLFEATGHDDAPYVLRDVVRIEYGNVSAAIGGATIVGGFVHVPPSEYRRLLRLGAEARS